QRIEIDILSQMRGVGIALGNGPLDHRHRLIGVELSVALTLLLGALFVLGSDQDALCQPTCGLIRIARWVPTEIATLHPGFQSRRSLASASAGNYQSLQVRPVELPVSRMPGISPKCSLMVQ